MFSRILVPLDGSPASEGALPYARTLAFGLGAVVELLHAVDPDELRVGADPSAGVESTQSYLAALGAEFPNVETAALIGNPTELIAQRAAANADTMVAMSTHGHSGIKRLVIGSVTDKVLRTVEQPLLVVHGQDEAPRTGHAMVDCIFLPLDGSEASEEAMPVAVELAKRLALPMDIVRTVPPVMSYYTPGADTLAGLEDVLEATENEAADYLARQVERARALGVETVRSESILGFPSAKLVDLAEQNPHGLMVMSTHGRSGLGRWVLGSVSDRLVRDPHQPVLLIRPE